MARAVNQDTIDLLVWIDDNADPIRTALTAIADQQAEVAAGSRGLLLPAAVVRLLRADAQKWRVLLAEFDALLEAAGPDIDRL